jgi:hypothetical protein
MIVITVLAFNFVGDDLWGALDPRQGDCYTNHPNPNVIHKEMQT